MILKAEDLDNGVRKITLDGRLDLSGVGSVELPLTSHASAKKAAIIVDMAKVTFIASLGMRLLMQCAKAQKNRGGKMVIYSLTPMVYKALSSAGIDTLVPIYDDEESATQAAQAAQ
ncbi:MAG: STAS domain-containing protein [Pseudomonadota bacterium]